MNFGAKLKQLRIQNGLSQLDLADKLGISRSSVSNYEQGTREPDFETLRAIKRIFDCDIDYLVDVKECDNQIMLESNQSILVEFEKAYSTLNDEGLERIKEYIEAISQMDKYKKEN